MIWNAISIRKKTVNGNGTEDIHNTICNIAYALFMFVLLCMTLSVYDYEHSKEETVANITFVKCGVLCEIKNFNNCLYHCNINFTYTCNNQQYAYHQKVKSSYNFENEKVIVVDTYYCMFYNFNIYIKYFISFAIIFIIALLILVVIKDIIEKRNTTKKKNNKYMNDKMDSKMLITN